LREPLTKSLCRLRVTCSYKFSFLNFVRPRGTNRHFENRSRHKLKRWTQGSGRVSIQEIMTIEKIDLENCFNITAIPRLWEKFKLSGEKTFDPKIYEPIVYKCSDCKKELTFHEKDFKKHSGGMHSNLNEFDKTTMDNFAKANRLDVTSFLDFYCPTCNRPTRIYYNEGYGGRHGDYIVNIEFGIKIKTS
jgi:hypothetical protein